MSVARERSYYLARRERYLPKDLTLVIVAESPPASGKYFYDEIGAVTEPLFRALMFDFLHLQPKTKSEGLLAFKNRGFLLVDATYSPVNSISSNSERDRAILVDYPALVADLLEISPDKKVRIILIKANICRLLESRLLHDGFTVLNNGRIIPFPSSGQQGKFKRAIGTLLNQVQLPIDIQQARLPILRSQFATSSFSRITTDSTPLNATINRDA